MSQDQRQQPTGWRDRAACLDEDPELFFPIGTTGTALEQADRAKQVCAVCPVKAICLEWALYTREPHGVWGGMGEDERRGLRRARQRARATRRGDGTAQPDDDAQPDDVGGRR
ncbi:MAG: WhiB family transcriptional regulator [Egibacteraceae bacterium]